MLSPLVWQLFFLSVIWGAVGVKFYRTRVTGWYHSVIHILMLQFFLPMLNCNEYYITRSERHISNLAKYERWEINASTYFHISHINASIIEYCWHCSSMK
ncbi:hypothetical protein ACLB2K_055483 [Fragaria x ananassa]